MWRDGRGSSKHPDAQKYLGPVRLSAKMLGEGNLQGAALDSGHARMYSSRMPLSMNFLPVPTERLAPSDNPVWKSRDR
jgi:hypothetical protein